MKYKKLECSLYKINRVAHIADIHIRPYRRHKEYKNVFNKLYKSLRDNKIELIVLVGDIVHAKTEMSPELVSITSTLFSKLSKIAPLIIIPGNHDANLSNPNRMDALSPIVENLSLANIFYLKDSGVYQMGNLNFVHMSVFDNHKNYIKANEISDLSNKIALYHGIVNNSVNDFDFTLKHEYITVNTFDGYDLVFLGDIHKHQFLNKEKTIGFCGSLICQNFGESLDKGYLIWDVNKRKSKFIKIENDFGFYTMEIKDKIIPDVTDMPKKCKLRLKIYDCSNKEIREISSKVRKKYNPFEITINRINTSNTIDDGNIKKIDVGNIHEVTYQNTLIGEHVDENYLIEPEIKDEILKINTELNNKIEIDDLTGNVRWKPIKFEWNNMFSYGLNNYIDFKNMRGVVGIFAPNAQGKSSLMESLCFCLFDKSSKDFKPINIMNNHSDFFNCKIGFELSGINYYIERDIRKNKKGDPLYKVNFWKDEEGEKYSLNGEKRWDTNKQIRNKIGTFDDFVLTSFSMQDDNNGIITKGNSERKDLIIHFIGLHIFDLLCDVATIDLKEIYTKLKLLQTEDWDEKLINIETIYESTLISYNSEVSSKNSLNKKCDSIKESIDDLKSQLKSIDEELDINVLKNQKQQIKEEIVHKKKKINEICDQVKIKTETIEKYKYNLELYLNMNVQKLYEEYVELKEERKNIQNEINKLKIVVSNKLDKMKKLGELKYDENCEYCMNNVFVIDAINVKKELEKDKLQANKMVLQLDSLDEIIHSKSDIEESYKNYNSLLVKKSNTEFDKNQLEIKSGNYNSELLELNVRYDKCKDNILKYYKNEDILKHNKNIHEKIKNESNILYKHECELEEINNKVMEHYSDLRLYENEKNEVLNKISELKETTKKYDSYKYYIDTIKRDGVPSDIISKILPTVESEVNDILHQIVDFSMLIDLDENKNINMYIVYDNDNYWPLELASGMEKFISSIALRVALTNISNLPRPNFLIIDEGWGKLDSDNLNSVSMLLDYLKTQFDLIIVISHIEQMRDVADSLIEIKKDKDGFSIIKHS